MKNPVYETMTKVQIGEFTVRLWVNSSELKFGPEKIPETKINFLKGMSPEDIVKHFSSHFGVSLAAIEVLNYCGNGFVYYPDWK